MEVQEAILKRRSIRKYTDEVVSDENIKQLLISAMAAPSACNKRPWEFYVVKDVETQKSLRAVHRYTNIPSTLIIVVCASTSRSLANRDNDFWIQDCSAAIENMLLTAVSLNLGTCWNGLFPLKTAINRVKKILELDEKIIPLGMVHIGHPNEELEARTQYNEKRVHYIENK